MQPSRIPDYHTNLIDNIFSNNLSDETKSVNIFLNLSEHFLQFVSVRRGKMNLKKVKIAQFLSYCAKNAPKMQNSKICQC